MPRDNDLLMDDPLIGSVLDMEPGDPVDALSYDWAAALQTPRDDGTDWSSMHEMALVYLVLVHRGAEERPEGQVALYEMLDLWYPEAPEQRIHRVVHEATLMFLSDARDQMLDVSIADLSGTMPRDQRIAVLSDLVELALAEGFIVPAEAAFIQRLAHAWDIEQEAP